MFTPFALDGFFDGADSLTNGLDNLNGGLADSVNPVESGSSIHPGDLGALSSSDVVGHSISDSVHEATRDGTIRAMGLDPDQIPEEIAEKMMADWPDPHSLAYYKDPMDG